MPQDFEKSKPRRNNEQKNYDEANNAGQSSNKNANQPQQENTRNNASNDSTEQRDREITFSDQTDVLAKRDASQTHDYKGEAQNVNDDTGRPLDEDELQHARNKATEGRRQTDAGTGRE